MNKFYEAAKKLYDNLRGGPSRRAPSSKVNKPPLKSPSDFYDDNIELGAGAMMAVDTDRVTKGMEELFDVPEGEIEGVSQEHIINYWEHQK